MTNTRKAAQVWLIVALCIVVLSLLGGCTRPVTVIETEPWKSCDGADYCQIGKVVCSNDNQPVIVLRAGMPEEQKPYAMIHEGTHVKQMRGHCNESRERFRHDSTFRVAMELEAYCTEAKERVRKGAPIQAVMFGLSSLFQALYEVDSITCPWLANPP